MFACKITNNQKGKSLSDMSPRTPTRWKRSRTSLALLQIADRLPPRCFREPETTECEVAGTVRSSHSQNIAGMALAVLFNRGEHQAMKSNSRGAVSCTENVWNELCMRRRHQQAPRLLPFVTLHGWNRSQWKNDPQAQDDFALTSFRSL